MPRVDTQNFFPAAVISMQNAQLQEALRRAGTGFDGARLEAIDEVGQDSWEKWRDEKADQPFIHIFPRLGIGGTSLWSQSRKTQKPFRHRLARKALYSSLLPKNYV